MIFVWIFFKKYVESSVGICYCILVNKIKKTNQKSHDFFHGFFLIIDRVGGLFLYPILGFIIDCSIFNLNNMLQICNMIPYMKNENKKL